jgi:hypothetical protein
MFVIRKIINSLPLRRKIASQFSSSAYVRTNKLIFQLDANIPVAPIGQLYAELQFLRVLIVLINILNKYVFQNQ